MTGKIVGIDLGTTNSVVSIVEGGAPIVIPSAEGDYLFPSVVGFSKSGERLVGSVAKRQAISNPEPDRDLHQAEHGDRPAHPDR